MRSFRMVFACVLAALCIVSFALRTQASENLDTQCPAYRFTSIEGKQITNTNGNGVKLLVFLKTDGSCGKSNAAISNLTAADWLGTPDLSVIAADCANNTVDGVRAFAETYTDGNKDITFCAGGNSYLWDLLYAVGYLNNSVTLPVSFVLGENGNIQEYMIGEDTVAAFENLLQGYIPETASKQNAVLSVNGMNVYSQAFEILDQINIQRARNGLSVLHMDAALLDTAMQRAAEISVYYSHTRPDGSSCFTAFPSGYYTQGENIAVGYFTADDVMNGWMNSTGHRENILSSGYSSVGVGVFLHNGVYTWVQVFSSQSTTGMTEIPGDAAKTAQIEVLEQHLLPKVSPPKLTLKMNKTERVFLYLPNEAFPSHNVFPDSASLTYRSDAPAVAAIDAQGLVTAVAPGTANITVGIAGTEKSVTLSVTVEDHNYHKTVQKEPTCAETGVALYTCEDCADTKTEEIPKLTEHTWDEGKVTKDPSESSEGTKTYTCTVCTDTKTESIPKLSPVATEPTVPPTQAPTVEPVAPPTVVPTEPSTAAPTEPSAAAPTEPATVPTVETIVPPTAMPTEPGTAVPTAPTAKPTVLPTAAPTTPATQPATEGTEPAEPTQPGTAPTDDIPEPSGEMTQPDIVPTELPATEPSSAPATQPLTEPDVNPGGDTKIIIGVAVAVAAILAGGGFLVFWKKKQ